MILLQIHLHSIVETNFFNNDETMTPQKLIASDFKAYFCSTLPETNIAPENRPSQKEIHLPTIHFQVLC